MLALMLAACSGSPEKANELAATAQQQLDAGQITAAQKTIAEAIKERDDMVALHVLRARIEMAANNLNGAYKAYQDALGLDAANLEALQGVAQLGLRVGDLRASEDAAERILNLQPGQIDALLITGVHHLIHNRAEEALAVADRVLKLDAGNEGGTILKARALFLDDRPEEALEAVQAREKLVGRSEPVAVTELELLRERHDAKGMLEVFAWLRANAPANIDRALDEANLRFKTGDTPGGRALLLGILRGAKPDAEQLNTVTGLWREYDPSPLSSADKLALTKAAPNIRIALARHFLRSGQPEAAAAFVDPGVSLEEKGLGARIAALESNAERAKSLSDAVLEVDETQCDALVARAATTQARAGVTAAQRAIAECPSDPAPALALAGAYARLRDVRGVERSYSDAVARIPQDRQLSAAFISWLTQQGRSREAVAEARRLTRKAPALLSAWRAYLQICQATPSESCANEAQAGLDAARDMLAIDPAPGTVPDRGLTGRLQH